jgi:hypothetical protein
MAKIVHHIHTEPIVAVNYPPSPAHAVNDEACTRHGTRIESGCCHIGTNLGDLAVCWVAAALGDVEDECRHT